jgi:threonine/homoserine/homoserine lactone efflux protein
MESLLLGLSLGLGAGLAPGPLLALVVGATLQRGFAAGAKIAAAPLVSDAPIVALCVLVLGELPSEVLAGLSLAGAAFVLWLAVDALRAMSEEAGPSDLRRAAVVNALSPHPWLFWLTAGGPLLVDDGPGPGIAFLVGFYVMLVGAKVAVAALVERGRRRGSGRLVPRSVAARVGTSGAVARFGAARLISAALLAIAAVALFLDGLSRL